tara:strand:+ start:310 stop:606 length:297 start_codon:yes stop_codon:yes gene_type:complete
MNIDANFDIDIDEIWSEIECRVEGIIGSEIEDKISDIETPEVLLDAYLTTEPPCHIGMMFEDAVWKAVTKRLDVEVKRVLRDILASDATQQEVAVAPV